jgi:hypothetical protein
MHTTKKWQEMARRTKLLDWLGRKGYLNDAYKNEPEGCGACVHPFGSNVDGVLSPAARR